MKIKKFNEMLSEEEDDNIEIPIGIDMDVDIEDLVHIFSPLESDMVDDWNSDDMIKKFVNEKRLFLTQIKYDEWSIYGKENDYEVKKYIKTHYSW